MDECDPGQRRCAHADAAGLPPLKNYLCADNINESINMHQLTEEHSVVAASPEKPPLVVEVGCSLPRPDGGR